jgi:uncharacterized Zn finger protein (UPF0148 family)
MDFTCYACCCENSGKAYRRKDGSLICATCADFERRPEASYEASAIAQREAEQRSLKALGLVA